MHIIRKIAGITKPYWPRVAGGIVISLLVSGITALIAWAVKPALDEIFVKERYEFLTILPAGVFLLFMTKGVLDFLQAYLMRSAGLKLMRETRNRLYNHILYLPIGYFSRESSGVVISRVMHDVEMLKDLISNVIRNFVVALPTALFLLGVAFYRKWDLTLMTLVLMPFLVYSTRKFGKRIKKKRKEAQRKMSFLTQNVGETILGSRIIKIFTRENFMGKRFEDENRRYYREMLRVVRFKEFTSLITDAVTGLGIAVILWYGGAMVQKGVMTPGDFASVIVAIYMLFPPIKKIGDAYTTLQETRASIERIDTLFDAAHEDPGKVRIDGFRDSLAYDKVSFAYSPGAPEVLHEIDLVIRPGEVVAVVGHSGAGKSTLIDLLPKFYRPTHGRITIDGTDLNDADTRSLRALMGIVSQDIILFNDTIRENISFGREGATEEEIVHAAKLAYVDDFVVDLPEKYDAVIGERGLKLSGGQRQRIAIARAILKNPPILILDEATSSLDSVSERLVQKALEDLMSGRTTIVIAHRLSTIRNADRIVILDRGKITDIGTHEQLMSRSDTYTKLYNAFAFSE